MASIFFAVILSSFMMSIKEGMYSQMIDSTIGNYTGFIQINTSAFTEDHLLDDGLELTDSLINALDSEPKISHYIPRIENFALAAAADQTKGSMVIGTDIEKEKLATDLHERVIEGSYLVKNDEGVLIGKGLAEYLKVKAGDTLVLLSQGYHGSSAAGKFPIRGIVTFGSPAMELLLR
jgi:ABC-type lipoprotein release transport system permease subunit